MSISDEVVQEKRRTFTRGYLLGLLHGAKCPDLTLELGESVLKEIEFDDFERASWVTRLKEAKEFLSRTALSGESSGKSVLLGAKKHYE